MAAPGAAMHGRKANRSPDWSGLPSLQWVRLCGSLLARRPDRLKGWCYTMCSMGKCTRKDGAPGTMCTGCALDGPRGS